MKRAIVGLCLVLLSSMAWALPTVQDVEAATRAGRYTEAETLMSEVVSSKPGSAKAHYIYAELLAHNGNVAKASAEAARAREIDPKIAFADPEKFRSFEQSLQRATTTPARSSATDERPARSTSTAARAREEAPARSGGIPGWVWFVGAAVLGVIAWRMMSQRRAAAGGGNPSTGANGPSGPNGYGGGPVGAPGGFPGAGGAGMQGQGYGQQGFGQQQQMGRPGGGLLGTGMAVAGGVAGGMLLNQVLNQHAQAGTTHDAGANNNMAGLDANSYNPARNDLADRQVDFGSGGDWDSGGGGDSGGDSGGGWD